MRSYHIDIARHATDAERKWIDNLLSHFHIPGVERTQRGSPRRITATGIAHIALIRVIALELDTTLRSPVAFADALMRAELGELQVFPGFSFKFDRASFESAVDARIAEAVESVVPAKRGRPPARGAHPSPGL